MDHLKHLHELIFMRIAFAPEAQKRLPINNALDFFKKIFTINICLQEYY